MRFYKLTVIGLLWFVLPLLAQENLAGVDEMMEQLPPELEDSLVDPLTVEKNISFARGESLKFKLGWGIFSVAKATLQTKPSVYEGKGALEITLSARTNSFADTFYKVRNTSTSWVADDLSRSFEYAASQNEGDRTRDTRALFDPDELTARYINNVNGENRAPVRIIPGTFDPLSIVFFARTLDFDVGDDLVVPTSNGKEFFFTVIHVKEKVTRRFRYGKREAYVLEPDIKDLGGVFKRSPNGNIRFFISADEEKLPLRLESEVVVGKFWAELVEVEELETADSVTVPEVE